MHKALGRALVATSLLASLGYGGIRWANTAGNPYRRSDFADIHFKLNSATAQTLVPDGDPLAPLQAALDSWNNVPYTALRFAPIETTTSGINSSDGQNVIAFADSPEARSALGSALAITVVASFVDGRIVDSDIILNPNASFSTTLQANTVDLQSLITHELGHSLGANHATVLSSTMFSLTARRDNSQAQLKADDAAFAVEVYPGPGAGSAYGSIAGIALKDGAPLPGAAVIAVNPETGTTIGGLSSVSDGSFVLRVPVGNYVVFAQPLAGLFAPGTFYNLPGLVSSVPFIPAEKVDVNFKAALAGGADRPALIKVTAEDSTTAAVTAAAGPSAIGISAAGMALGTSYSIGPRPVVVVSGQPFDLIVSGPGLGSSITEQDIRLVGPGVTLRPGTLRVDNQIVDTQGRFPLRFTIDVAPQTSRALVSVFILHDSDTALLAGGITVLPSKPTFTASSLVDAASFKGAGVAPGELISLFGTGIGPGAPVTNSGFDPSTGALPTTLAGVSVTFDGIRAPLIFAASGQINLQVPYEVAGQGSALVVVQNNAASSDPVTVRVASAQPGIFAQSGSSQASAVNSDNTVNSAQNPAARGSVVTLYASGAGVVDPPVPTGQPAPALPLSVANAVVLRIDGIDAKLFFGGLAPGFVGLLQLNAEVPARSATGSVPVELTIRGQASQAQTTIAVR